MIVTWMRDLDSIGSKVFCWHVYFSGVKKEESKPIWRLSDQRS